MLLVVITCGSFDDMVCNCLYDDIKGSICGYTGGLIMFMV